MIMENSIRLPGKVRILGIAVGCLLLTFSTVLGDVIARYSGSFMDGGGDARSLAMGGAYTAASGDGWSIFWNPAGLAGVTTPQAGLMHSERFSGVIDYDAAAVALPQADGSVISGGLIRLGVNGIPFTRLENEYPGAIPSEDNRVEISKYVNEGEYALFASKASTYKHWSWGIAPKLIFKHIGSEHQGFGLGIDAGVRCRIFREIPLTAGLAVHDFLGTPLIWDTGRKEIIISTLRFGLSGEISVKSLEAVFNPVFDVAYRLENAGGSNALSLHYGLEYLIRNRVALRIGSDNDRLAFGGGLVLKPVSIDYAYIEHDELGDTHRVSLMLRWGHFIGKS